ncbi:MAG: hypothetical protein H0X50_09850, partial [Nitrosopumilus sp.]|nr:hypothetical protein [Nitrosopumilus sp.]
MSSINVLLQKKIGFLLIAILSVGIVTEISLITYASALNYYFNCVTKKVNKGEQFEMQDAFLCYDNVFKGAQKYSNEPYQNPDLTKLDGLKPVADSTNEEDKTDLSIVKPSENENESEKSNGNPVAENESEKSNGNPVAENESEKSNGNPVAEDKVEKDSQSDETDKDAKSPQDSNENPIV